VLRLLAVLTVAAAAAITVSDERDISATAGTQAEVDVAIDPSNPSIILAASNNATIPSFTRTYTSTDGGKTWRTRVDVPDSAADEPACGDPAPAIDASGRQYVGFLTCADKPYASVATRAGPDDAWELTNRPLSDGHIQDKPALAVDSAPGSTYAGRLYIGFFEATQVLVLVHSDDAGATWSSPVRLVSGRGVDTPQFLSLAIGRGGVVSAGWFTFNGRIFVTRSTDGGETFAPRRMVFRLAARHAAWDPPAQPDRGATANPRLVVDTSGGTFDGRAYMSFADRHGKRTNAYVLTLASDLTPLGRPRAVVPAPRRPADRFLPAIAVDRTTGDVWECFYATDGSRVLTRARWSCTVSQDGGSTWSAPVRAASAFSDLRKGHGGDAFNFGDYEGVAAADGAAHPVWTDGRIRTRRADIWTATLHAP
jgi:hypothetical protein